MSIVRDVTFVRPLRRQSPRTSAAHRHAPAATLLASGSGISIGGCLGEGGRSGSGGNSGGGAGGRSGGGSGGGGSGRGGNSGGGCGGAGSGFWAMPLLRSVVSMGATRSPHSTRPPGLFSHCVRVRTSTFALSHGVASGLTPSQPTQKLAPWTTVLGIDRLIVLTGDLSTRRGALSLLPAACPIDMATIEHAGRTSPS